MKVSKLLKINTSIPKERKIYIKSCIKEFNKNFPDTPANMFSVTRNKVGIPFHMLGFISCIGGLIKAFDEQDCFRILESVFWSKINIDFAIWINNINKKKASLFSSFLKKKNITDEKELIYGIKKYLVNIGSYHYPFLHPQKTKRIALTGKWHKTFETGIIATRTDKKSLMDKYQQHLNRQYKKKLQEISNNNI